MILKTMTMVDTCEFQRWSGEKHGISNSDWHKLIWRDKNGLCSYFENGPYCTFTTIDNPENLLEEHVNEFLEDFPELGGKVTFIFTN